MQNVTGEDKIVPPTLKELGIVGFSYKWCEDELNGWGTTSTIEYKESGTTYEYFLPAGKTNAIAGNLVDSTAANSSTIYTRDGGGRYYSRTHNSSTGDNVIRYDSLVVFKDGSAGINHVYISTSNTGVSAQFNGIIRFGKS